MAIEHVVRTTLKKQWCKIKNKNVISAEAFQRITCVFLTSAEMTLFVL
jgi:hypothetical protein